MGSRFQVQSLSRLRFFRQELPQERAHGRGSLQTQVVAPEHGREQRDPLNGVYHRR
jgi:hypothetical protein